MPPLPILLPLKDLLLLILDLLSGRTMQRLGYASLLGAHYGLLHDRLGALLPQLMNEEDGAKRGWRLQGGAGWGKLPRFPFALGGHILQANLGSQQGPLAKLQAGLVGGTVRLGHTSVKLPGAVVIPFVGAGAGLMELKLQNTGSSTLALDEDQAQTLAAGQLRNYRSWNALLEAGAVAMIRPLPGIWTGVELGIAWLPAAGWRDADGNRVEALKGLHWPMLYIRWVGGMSNEL